MEKRPVRPLVVMVLAGCLLVIFSIVLKQLANTTEFEKVCLSLATLFGSGMALIGAITLMLESRHDTRSN